MRKLTRWDEELDGETTSKLTSVLALKHLSLVSSPAATLLATAVSSSDVRLLCLHELDYAGLSTEDAKHLRQALAFYSKRQDLDVGIDKRRAAVDSFWAAERLCGETNRLLRLVRSGRLNLRPLTESVVFTAQRKIARILGPVPRLSDLSLRLGPGATTMTRKADACTHKKLGAPLACSESLAPHTTEVLRELPGLYTLWGYEGPVEIPRVEVHTSRIAFVPKNAKTYRGIGVEPLLNTMCQLGIGDYIANRLRRWGVDISDQTLNQRLAEQGSIDGSLATVDLSSASDTIAYELVADLLPVDWFFFLRKFISRRATLDGQEFLQEKFSSMGNGFTFALETLIFYALAKATCEVTEQPGAVNAYGDDIIVPVGAFDSLHQVFQDLGFVFNRTKSYKDGGFRESCGKDFLFGAAIRPFYLKDTPTGATLFTLYNFYKRAGLDAFAEVVLDFIPEPIRLWGPDGFGDGHLIGDHPRRQKPRHLSRGFDGYVFDTYTFKSRRKYMRTYGDRGAKVLPLYSVYRSHKGLWVEETRSRTSFLRMEERFTTLRAAPEGSSGGWDEHGRWETTPGEQGYRRISVYTF